MKALSIRQPWAWMILHAGKDIENREWPTRFRGRVLIHASKAAALHGRCQQVDAAIAKALDLLNPPLNGPAIQARRVLQAVKANPTVEGRTAKGQDT